MTTPPVYLGGRAQGEREPPSIKNINSLLDALRVVRFCAAPFPRFSAQWFAQWFNRNKGVWGEDADEFRPERWLKGEGEAEEEYKARLQRMNAAELAFGGGSRICMGRNLALVEVYKIVATLVNRYEIELAHPEKEWHVICRWFMRQKGLETKISLTT
jgi:hypothetical protein